MKIVDDFDDYEIIDAANGEKLERWGNIYLLRPDPQVVWQGSDLAKEYKGLINAHYHRSNKGGGYWEEINSMPDRWTINYKGLVFNLKKMGFKHTGLFPEQAINWNRMMDTIKESSKDIKVLNLFAYTGGASLACLKAGASVVHVDSSKGMVQWAKENVKSSNLEDRPIRFLVDDVKKFVAREIRRGNKYDAIIMDPPSYGKGANNEVWSIETDLDELITMTSSLLSDKPLFYLINSYTTGLSSTVMENILKLRILHNHKGKVDSYEIGLKIKKNDLVLPAGISTWVDFDE
ncbi:MAG: class I SAM-dependent methyltransferase [Bacilli bacterium]|nr:class I SAM-dependent methyltransferase [Bacilli bacterium]